MSTDSIEHKGNGEPASTRFQLVNINVSSFPTPIIAHHGCACLFSSRPTDEARIKREEQMRGHQSSVSKHPVPTQARRALGLRGGGCLMGRAAPKDKKAELKRREREFVFQPPGPAITWLKGERVGEEPSPSTGFPSGGGQRQPLVQTQTRQQQAPAPIPQRSIRVPQKPPNEKEKKRRLNERVARLDFKPVRCTLPVHVPSHQMRDCCL